MSLGILIDVGKSPSYVSRTDTEGNIYSLDLDVSQDEVHEWTNDVTNFPVELGSPITDHIQTLPDKISINGLISNSAIGETALGKIVGGEDRCQTSFDMLRKMMDDRLLVTVYTRYKIYTDMALKSVNIPRDSAIGDCIKFKMEFINVRLVSTQTTEVPAGISKKLDKKNGDDVKKKTEPQKPNGKVDTRPVYQRDKSNLKAMTPHDQEIEKQFKAMNGLK